MPAAPKRLLRDGQPWSEFTYDPASRRIAMKRGDPRLHVFETSVRERVIDLDGKANVKLDGITVTNTL